MAAMALVFACEEGHSAVPLKSLLKQAVGSTSADFFNIEVCGLESDNRLLPPLAVPSNIQLLLSPRSVSTKLAMLDHGAVHIWLAYLVVFG